MCRYGPQNQNNFNSISVSSEGIRYGFQNYQISLGFAYFSMRLTMATILKNGNHPRLSFTLKIYAWLEFFLLWYEIM